MIPLNQCNIPIQKDQEQTQQSKIDPGKVFTNA